MRIRNNSARRVSLASLNASLGPGEEGTVNTFLAMGSDELQAYVTAGTIVVVSTSTSGASLMDSFVVTEQQNQSTISSTDSAALTGGGSTALHYHSADRARANHTGTQLKATISDFSHGSSSHTGAIGTLSQVSDVTITVANLNTLDDGVSTALHFHDADRSRANHTGTQLKATISDFSHGATSHTGAIGTLSQISDVTMTVANLNSLDDGVDTTLHFHASDRSRANHTGTQLKATISDFTHDETYHTGVIGMLASIGDVTMTAANLNTLDDGVDTTLHFHASDRARANHTGTQLKATISDFAHGATSHTGSIGTLSQISDVVIAAGNLNAYLPTVGTTGARPDAATGVAVGHMYFDQTLGKPVWSNGTIWVYADGTAA